MKLVLVIGFFFLALGEATVYFRDNFDDGGGF